MNERKDHLLKQLEKLYDTRKLYDCQFRCYSAIAYLLKKGICNAENISAIFDETKTCQHLSVREFVSNDLPEISTYCLCSDFADKIKKIEATYSIVTYDMSKEPPEKK